MPDLSGVPFSTVGTASKTTPRTRFRTELSGKRVINGTLVALLGVASVLLPTAFAALVLLIAVMAAIELYGLSRRVGAGISLPVVLGACAVYQIAAYLGLLPGYESILVAVIVMASVLAALIHGFDRFALRVGMTLFAVLYLGKFLSYFIAIRNAHDGMAFIFWIITVVALTDIVAMLVGLRFGRRPLARRISPGKTWEGAIAAFFASTLIGTGVALSAPISAAWWAGLSCSACLSIAAQIGDLIESALKRYAQVKDSGQLIAGHGGVLDRFDSYIVSGIVAYAAFRLVGLL